MFNTVVASKLRCSGQSSALENYTDPLCSSLLLKDPALHLRASLCSLPCICTSTVQYPDFTSAAQLIAQSL